MKNFKIIRVLIAILFFTSIQAKAFVHMTARMSGIPVVVKSKSVAKTEPCALKSEAVRPVAATIKTHHFRYERKAATNASAYVLDWRLTKKHAAKPVSATPRVVASKMTIPVVRPAIVADMPSRKFNTIQTVTPQVSLAAPRKVVYTALATRKKKKNIYFSVAAHMRNNEQLSKDMAFLFGGIKQAPEKVAMLDKKKNNRYVAKAERSSRDMKKRLVAISRVPVHKRAGAAARMPHASKSATMQYVYAAAHKHKVSGVATKRTTTAFTAKQVVKPTILSTESGALAKATGKYDIAIETAVRAAGMFSAIKNVPVILIDNVDRPSTTATTPMTHGAVDVITGHSVVLKHNNWMDQFGPEMAMK
ncbi:MAG: hypothetical protein IAE95_04590 [Chitinophagaceae bacterium]|nr:hypothetical protein [Chitinophagaceae bacterium]